MLYDPKWEAKSDMEYAGVSIRAFTNWLAQQPQWQEYSYEHIGSCAVAQFLASQGKTGAECEVDFWPQDRPVSCAVLHNIVAMKPWTFGDALRRARASVLD